MMEPNNASKMVLRTKPIPEKVSKTCFGAEPLADEESTRPRGAPDRPTPVHDIPLPKVRIKAEAIPLPTLTAPSSAPIFATASLRANIDTMETEGGNSERGFENENRNWYEVESEDEQGESVRDGDEDEICDEGESAAYEMPRDIAEMIKKQSEISRKNDALQYFKMQRLLLEHSNRKRMMKTPEKVTQVSMEYGRESA